ncbi:hypothetical protein VNO77_00821 [Canavalia gladiata]|uniref:Albumin I chain a domain-containing protein n=1 Tax=Canavalia gladiata TaxID=3824 RepID=A0AAN9R4R2_CANGL
MQEDSNAVFQTQSLLQCQSTIRMAYPKFAPLAVFVFAMLLMFSMKKIEASCKGVCTPFKDPPCGSSACRCVPALLFAGICVARDSLASAANMIEAHPHLCQSNDECLKKGSGNFCARFPNPDVEYGWCINSDAGELLKDFLKMSTPINQ